MPTPQERRISIEHSDEGSRSGVLHVTAFNSSDRMRRAVKTLAIMWGIALVTLFIPLAHFVLVPAFLIMGPILAVKRYKLAEVVEKATGACPKCGDDMTIELEPEDKLPHWTYCPLCNTPLQLVDKE
ncbi:MAG: hypothetical protein GXP10_09815 [Gammaproteobacteria bacterium]|nr:hypothetical protein [Gammaproteobacteria bacterium]